MSSFISRILKVVSTPSRMAVLLSLTLALILRTANSVLSRLQDRKELELPRVADLDDHLWTIFDRDNLVNKVVKAQTFADAGKQSYMASKKTLEINPLHPVIKELATKSADNADDAGLRDLANLMFDAALIQSGFSMDNAEEFASRIHRVVRVGLDVDPSAQVEEEPEEEVPAEEEGEAEAAEEPEEKEEL